MTDLKTMDEIETKSAPVLPAFYKADDTDAVFTAIVSVFDVADKSGDITRLGCFERTLAEFKASGKVLPVVWSHGMGTPDYYVGSILEAKELAPGDSLLPDSIKDFGGLWVKGDFDDDPTATKVRKLMKGKRITEFSYGYTTVKTAVLEHEGKTYRELLDVDLWEIGPTIRGLHPATSTLYVKSAIAPSDTDAPAEEKGNDAQDPAPALDLAKARLALLDL